MRGDTFITFRGEEDVCIEYEVDFSGPGSGVGVQWWFKDKTPEEHDALKITNDEDEAISTQVVDAAIAKSEAGCD